MGQLGHDLANVGCQLRPGTTGGEEKSEVSRRGLDTFGHVRLDVALLAIPMERPLLLTRFFKPICVGPTMFELAQTEWKPWVAILSKGYSAEHVLSRVHGVVDETAVYYETLRKLAFKREFV